MSDQKNTSNMTTEELLSALVDGELSEVEIDQILATASPQSLEQFSRFRLAQDAMQKDTYVPQPVDVFASISAAIEQEPTPALQVSTEDTQPVNTFDESLSALVDDELSELELRRILKSSDEAALEKLGRYHLISNVLRKEVSLAQSIDVSAAVSASIASEETPKQAQPKKGLWANIGRVGIAASVAGALVVGVQFLSTTAPQNIAENNVAPISGEPLITNENSVRVVGNESSVKAIDDEAETLNEDEQKPLK